MLAWLIEGLNENIIVLVICIRYIQIHSFHINLWVVGSIYLSIGQGHLWLYMETFPKSLLLVELLHYGVVFLFLQYPVLKWVIIEIYVCLFVFMSKMFWLLSGQDPAKVYCVHSYTEKPVFPYGLDQCPEGPREGWLAPFGWVKLPFTWRRSASFPSLEALGGLPLSCSTVCLKAEARLKMVT